jgi:hypothetical protein
MNVLNNSNGTRYPVAIIHRKKPFDVSDVLPKAADKNLSYKKPSKLVFMSSPRPPPQIFGLNGSILETFPPADAGST